MNFPKIAIVDPVGIKAGLDHYDISLAGELNKLSFSTKVYSNFEFKDSKINEKIFPFFIKRSLINIFSVIHAFLSVLRKARKEKVDIIILHVFHFSFFDYLFIRLVKRYKIKVCLIVHDVESLIGNKKTGWLKECINHSEKIIVHNVIVSDELKTKADVKNYFKISIIRHGNYIDYVKSVERNEALTSLNLDPGKNYLLFFGMIKKSKGLEVLLNAMKEVGESTHLIIAGRTRDVAAEDIKGLVRKLKLEERTHLMLGYISNEKRDLLFNAVEAVILPYHRIYQSGVMIMAMSYGKVVIASDLPVNKMMLNENAGLLFKVGNYSDLAEKIISLKSDKKSQVQIQRSALEFISKNNNWADIANEYAKILKI